MLDIDLHIMIIPLVSSKSSYIYLVWKGYVKEMIQSYLMIKCKEMVIRQTSDRRRTNKWKENQTWFVFGRVNITIDKYLLYCWMLALTCCNFAIANSFSFVSSPLTDVVNVPRPWCAPEDPSSIVTVPCILPISFEISNKAVLSLWISDSFSDIML